MIHHYLSAVSDFHAVFKHRQPQPIIPDFTDATTNELRPKLCREELHELRDAIVQNNRVEILDALCDSQYVLSGAVLDWGLRNFFHEETITVQLRKIQDVDDQLARMFGAIDMMENAAQQNLGHSVAMNLRSLQSHLTRCVWHFDMTHIFREAFDTVHANNMGKIWPENEVIMCADQGMEFEKTTGGFIARRADRKIMKPPGFVKVSLERFV